MKNKIGYTWGVWDLFHYGHMKLLKEAKKYCDDLGYTLVVGVYTDKAAKEFKRKPVMNFDRRIEMIKELGFQYVMQGDVSPDKNVELLAPSLVIKGPGAGWEKRYNKFRKKTGIDTILLHYHKGISTTEIIKRCKKISL